MITNEEQYRATKAHLAQFNAAADNLNSKERSRLMELELSAVMAQADDLRAEISEYELLR